MYRAEGFQALAKIEVRANGRQILARLNVVDDAAIVGCHELGLSEDAFAQAAKACLAAGALSFDVAVTHALFAGDALDVVA